MHPDNPTLVFDFPDQTGAVRRRVFTQPIETVAARTVDEVRPALRAVQRAAEVGLYAAGYVAYEWVHWATHYRVPQGRILKALRRHHMIHHHAQPRARFGVTSPLWDWVFRTLPPAPGR